MNRRTAGTLLAMLAIAGGACSDDERTATVARTAQAPTRPTLAVHPSVDGSATALLHGTLLADDCVILRKEGDRDYVAIFPERAKLTEHGVELDGQLLRFGSNVRLGGGETTDAGQLREFGGDACGPTAGVLIGEVAEPTG